MLPELPDWPDVPLVLPRFELDELELLGEVELDCVWSVEVGEADEPDDPDPEVCAKPVVAIAAINKAYMGANFMEFLLYI